MKLTQQEQEALRQVGKLLVQIRYIAGDASRKDFCDWAGMFNEESACQAIYALADAAHNIPTIIANGKSGELDLLFACEMEQIENAQDFVKGLVGVRNKSITPVKRLFKNVQSIVTWMLGAHRENVNSVNRMGN